MNGFDLLQIVASYKEVVGNMTPDERRMLRKQIEDDSGKEPEMVALGQLILKEIDRLEGPTEHGTTP